MLAAAVVVVTVVLGFAAARLAAILMAVWAYHDLDSHP